MTGGSKQKTRSVYRKEQDREGLDHAIINWLRAASANDLVRGVRPMYNNILSYHQRVKLVCAPPDAVRSSEAIVALLEENEKWAEEWATSLYKVVAEYDAKLPAVSAEKSC